MELKLHICILSDCGSNSAKKRLANLLYNGEVITIAELLKTWVPCERVQSTETFKGELHSRNNLFLK